MKSDRNSRVCRVVVGIVFGVLAFAEAIHLLGKLAKTEPRVRLAVLGQTAEWMELQGDSERDELEPIGTLGQTWYEISQGNLGGAIAALELIRETSAGAALRARIDAETQK